MANTQVRFMSNNDTIDQGTVQDIDLQSDDYDAIETKKQNELNKTSDFETSSQQDTDNSRISNRKTIHANTHVSDISNIDTISQATAPETELHSANFVTIQPKKKKERNHTSDFESLSQHVNNRSRKFISNRKTINANTHVSDISNIDTISQATAPETELHSANFVTIQPKKKKERNHTSNVESLSQHVNNRSRKFISNRKTINANTHVRDISNIDTISQATAPETELHSANFVTIQPKKKKERNHTSNVESLSQHVNNRSRKFISHRNTIRAHPHISVSGYNETVDPRIVQEIGLQSRIFTPRMKKAISGILLAVIVFVVFMYIFNQCIIGPCVNGKCVNGMGNYRCLCYDGFYGTDCKHSENSRNSRSDESNRFLSEQSEKCIPEPCVNGKCINGKGYYKCLCDDGFYGTDCEHNIDECSSDPCVNATCYDGIGKYSCLCNEGSNGADCEQLITTDCADILHYTGNRTDGIYTVRTWKSHQPINVYCDMTTDGGGWTVFQNRFDGSVDFYRHFSEYDTGFGDLTTEFWLGLSNIQELAVQGQTDLRIDLEAANGTKAYETFDNFYLSPGPAYTLHLGSTIASKRISSNYSFGAYHNGRDFSTYDNDVDAAKVNCAFKYHGAWWYKHCLHANLNGLYLTPGTKSNRSMIYVSFLYTSSLKTSKMMMRRK